MPLHARDFQKSTLALDLISQKEATCHDIFIDMERNQLGSSCTRMSSGLDIS